MTMYGSEKHMMVKDEGNNNDPAVCISIYINIGYIIKRRREK